MVHVQLNSHYILSVYLCYSLKQELLKSNSSSLRQILDEGAWIGLSDMDTEGVYRYAF